MIWEDLNENLIVPDLEAKSSDEVFEKLGGLFIAEGYCKDTYINALKDREKIFRQELIWEVSESQFLILINSM